MAYTQDDLTALEEAIAGGELSVEINGKKVIYRNMSELMQAHRFVSQALSAATAPRSALGGHFVIGSSGRGRR